MNSRRRIFQNKNSQAHHFHERAWSFLSSLGFVLDNDPTVVLSPYQLTVARYKSSRGLYIAVYFDPADSNSVGINCGRKWHHLKIGSLRDPYTLSGEYSALAKRFGIDLQSTFRLGYEEEVPQTMDKILHLLKETLPVIMERTTLQDLTSIEKEKFGAEEKAISLFGDDFENCIEISLYNEK